MGILYILLGVFYFILIKPLTQDPAHSTCLFLLSLLLTVILLLLDLCY